MRRNRILVLTVYALFVVSAPITVLLNTPISFVFKNDILTINFFQRVFGLSAFVMLSTQLILGSHMGWWIKKLGGKAYKYHITHGLLAYFFFLTHPLMQTLIDFNLSGPLGSAISLLPGRDIFLNLGKMALYLLTAGVFAAYFRTKPIFRKHWRKFHYLNYLAFVFVAIHSWNLGTDVRTLPFLATFAIGHIAVSAAILLKFYPLVRSKLAEYFLGPSSPQG